MSDFRDSFSQNRYPLAVSVALSAVVCYFNYGGPIRAEGIFKYYLCFRDTIASGFDLAAHGCDSTTFPMWGYGWLLLLTQNKPVLLLLQCSLSVFAVAYFLHTIRATIDLGQRQFQLLKWLAILSLPVYALNALLSPHAVATALLWISLALLMRAQHDAESGLRIWILSGLCFGVMLNFRSDYILLPIGLLSIAILVSRHPFRKQMQGALAWSGIMLLMILPWGFYTKAATDHFLQNSTNGGHVLYIGLGQLPGNIWGITPRDNDPSMAAVVQRSLGKPQSSLTYEADVVLKTHWRELVLASPSEYARKVAHNFRALLISGTYAGTFHERPECQPHCLNRYVDSDQPMTSQSQVAKALLTGRATINPDLPLVDYIRLALLGTSVAQSIAVTLLGFLLAIALTPYCLLKRNAPLLLLLAVIGYQITLGSLTFFMRTYSSSVYLLLLVAIVFAGDRLLRSRLFQIRALVSRQDPPPR